MIRVRTAGGWALGAWLGVAASAAPGAAQEPPPTTALASPSPVQVETLETEPTVVKTGDVLRQRYRLRFPDLVAQGKEVLILEDRMVPQNLPVHPFEAVSLDVDRRVVESEHVWDVVYGFRLISPHKETYTLPGISFFYIVRDLGEDVEAAEVQKADAAGALVRYVTTITEAPVLDIRDTIELGSFAGHAALFRTIAWGIAPLPLLFWLVMLVRVARRRPRTITGPQQQEVDELSRLEAQIPIPPSLGDARRNLRCQLMAVQAMPAGANGAALLDIQRGLIISAREYLQAEMPELNTGDTPRDIRRRVEGLKEGDRKDALQMLAGRLVAYQSAMESGLASAIEDPVAEAQALEQALKRLQPHVRLWMSVREFVGR